MKDNEKTTRKFYQEKYIKVKKNQKEYNYSIKYVKQ